MIFIKDFLEVPKECVIDKVIAKDKIANFAELKTKDKDLFKEYVSQIRWYSRFAQDNLHIPPYNDDEKDYNEVQIINVILKEEKIKELSETQKKETNSFFVQDKKIDRIIEIVFRSIMFPQLIVVQYKSKIKLCVTHIRKNLADTEKITFEEIISTDWIDFNNLKVLHFELFNNIQLNNLNHTNFFMFYSDIVNSIIQYNGATLTGTKVSLPADEVKLITDRIKELEKEIENMKRELKRETQPPLISKINNEIRIRRIELRDLKKQLA